MAEHAAISLEASGTSGMKAALNGVPSLSILDGWWSEGHIEGVTGWSIGDARRATPDLVTDNHADAESLYTQTGKRDRAYVLQRARPLSQRDAACHRRSMGRSSIPSAWCSNTSPTHTCVSFKMCYLFKIYFRMFLYIAIPTAASMPIFSSAAISPAGLDSPRGDDRVMVWPCASC